MMKGGAWCLVTLNPGFLAATVHGAKHAVCGKGAVACLG